MDMAFHAQPFGFERVFAAHASNERERSPAQLLLQLEACEAELAALRQHHKDEIGRARTDAFDAGLNHARHEREVALLSAVDALHAGVETIEIELDSMRHALTRDAAELALAGARHIAAHSLPAISGEAIEGAIGRALSQVARGTELVVRVHPAMVGDIERRIAARQAGDRRRLNLYVQADASLAEGDAHIDWDEGRLLMDRASRIAAVEAEITGVLDIG